MPSKGRVHRPPKPDALCSRAIQAKQRPLTQSLTLELRHTREDAKYHATGVLSLKRLGRRRSSTPTGPDFRHTR